MLLAGSRRTSPNLFQIHRRPQTGRFDSTPHGRRCLPEHRHPSLPQAQHSLRRSRRCCCRWWRLGRPKRSRRMAAACGRPSHVPRYGKFGVRASTERERQAMVLRGTTVQLNSGLTAPKISRPLRPARHCASVAPVSCLGGAPHGHRKNPIVPGGLDTPAPAAYTIATPGAPGIRDGGHVGFSLALVERSEQSTRGAVPSRTGLSSRCGVPACWASTSAHRAPRA